MNPLAQEILSQLEEVAKGLIEANTEKAVEAVLKVVEDKIPASIIKPMIVSALEKSKAQAVVEAKKALLGLADKIDGQVG